MTEKEAAKKDPMTKEDAQRKIQEALVAAYDQLRIAQDVANEHGLVFALNPPGSNIYPRVYYYGDSERAGIDPNADPQDGVYGSDGRLWWSYENNEPWSCEWVSSSQFC